jgi:DNA mismatch repair protein MutS2
MPFSVGDEVVVTALQKRGRILEAAASGRYRVAIGALSSWCEESQLSSVSQGKKKAKRQRTGAALSSSGAGAVLREASEAERRRLQSIDLHGMTVDEALRAVEARVDEAIRAGLERLEIIHGISGGRLRAAVRGYLEGIPSVSRFEGDARNAGVTWVYL